MPTMLTSTPELTETQPQPRIRLEFLDGLRGLAALYVVFYHVYCTAAAPLSHLPHWEGGVFRIFAYGHYAVSVFIVLSGYCLMMPIVGSRKSMLRGGVMGFLKRRAQRILPPYYAALVLSYLLILAERVPRYALGRIPSLGSDFSWDSVISHILLIHNLVPKWEFEVNYTLWTVATEWQIYFVFALLLLPIWRLGAIPLLALAGLVVGLLPHILLPPGRNLDNACPWYVTLFTFGAIAACINFSQKDTQVRFHQRMPYGLFSLCLFGVFALLAVHVDPQDVWARNMMRFYVPTTDVLLGMAVASLIVYCSWVECGSRKDTIGVNRFLCSKHLVGLGSFSYSLYLIHAPVIEKVEWVLSHLHLPGPLGFVVLLAAGVPCSLAAAYVFHLAFERPFLKNRASAGGELNRSGAAEDSLAAGASHGAPARRKC